MQVKDNGKVRVFLRRFFDDLEGNANKSRPHKSELSKDKVRQECKSYIFDFEYNDKDELVWYEIISNDDRYRGIGTLDNEWFCYHYRNLGPVKKILSMRKK